MCINNIIKDFTSNQINVPNPYNLNCGIKKFIVFESINFIHFLLRNFELFGLKTNKYID